MLVKRRSRVAAGDGLVGTNLMRRIPASEADAGFAAYRQWWLGSSNKRSKDDVPVSYSAGAVYNKQPYAAVLVPGRRIFDTAVMRCGRTNTTLGLEGSG